MTTEQFLNPRVKVIGDYPNSPFNLSEILPMTIYNNGFYCSIYGHYTKDKAFFEKYPHLFKILDWWEEREFRDMPEYVKDGDKILRVNAHFSMVYPVNSANNNEILHDAGSFIADNRTYAYWTVLPATREEYDKYNEPF